jgi:transglutaminase-like putative cysteine protease
LNTRINDSFQYARREESGVQPPCQTLASKSGSCRDYAVLMMEAARHLGFGARLVTGYIQMGEGQHGATHPWTEIYLPGSGWRGFDPTNNKLVGFEHVSVAVAAEHAKASTLSAHGKARLMPSNGWKSLCKSSPPSIDDSDQLGNASARRRCLLQ